MAPDTDCLRVGDESVSRGELLATARRVGAALVGSRAVAVRATPSIDTVVAVVAGLLAGVPIVPVPADSGAAETRYVLDDSGAQVLLSDRPGEGASGLGVPCLPVRRLAGRESELPRTVHPDTEGLIVYTSGTTGPPKGVVLSHRSLAADLDGLADAWGWTGDDTVVHGLPLFHVHGLVLGTLGPLRLGGRVHHTIHPTAEAYANASGTMYFGVPTIWARIARDENACAALRSARLLVSGSAALPLPVFETVQQRTGHTPIERYGMTETLITLSTRADGERRPGWVGSPIAGVEARLVDDAGLPAPHDSATPANLQVRGATLFDGYLGRAEATAACFDTEGWFSTGDLAIADEAGFFKIVGRASIDLISSGGYRIGAGEVEDALLAHPGVHEVAVVGTPHPDLGEQVCAFVVAEHVKAEDLIAFAAERLSAHKRPRQVVFVDALPRNPMGKVLKSELR